MSSGGGSGSTPNTPNSTTLPPAPMSPIVSLLHQTAAGGGLRYPLYTVQGAGSLVYSPTMLMPWRQIGPTAQSTSANSSSVTSAPIQNTIPGLTQVPQGGLVYPINLPMLSPAGIHRESRQGEAKKVTDGGKRRIDSCDYWPEAKHPRLSSSSPSLTSSPSSHPGTPPHTSYKPPEHSTRSHQSPVIKVFGPGHSVIIPTNPPPGNPRTPPSVFPTASVHPVPSHHPPPMAVVPEPKHSSVQQRLKHTRSLRAQCCDGGAPSDSVPASNKMSPRLTATQLSPPSLPDTLHLVLFKCLGGLPGSVLNHPSITVSSQLHDLYKQFYTTTSMTSDPLSPESACSLTIFYLNSLRPGEAINVESLRTMMHYAQQGETEWIHYYKKHKKMSESTYVQSQLFHLSRMAVYPLQGRAQVMTSHQSLEEGLMQSLHHLQYMVSGGHSLPEYVVVMSVHQSSAPNVTPTTSPTVNFCVLMVEPLQVLRVREAELLACLGSHQRRQHSKIRVLSPPTKPTRLSLPSKVIASIQQFEKSLKGTVHVPFYLHDESLLVGQRSDRMSTSRAESMVPVSSHVIEHKPMGPFQQQCNMAMILRQKILSSFDSARKFEHFKNIDFRVLCPPDACFVSQTVSEVTSSRLLEYLEAPSLNDPPSRTSGSPSSPSLVDLDFEAEARRRAVCCNLTSDAPRFQALLNDIRTNKDTLFLIVVENAHLTTRIATKSFLSANAKPVLETEHSFVPTSDCLPLLCNFNNCIFLNISSHPYSLQTTHSLVSPAANQVHWSPSHSLTKEERGGGQFCSVDTFQSHPSAADELGVSFKEDPCFEELFHKTAAKLNQSSVLPAPVLSVRAQLLLEQYVLSLLVAVGRAPSSSHGEAQPETLALVTRLVKTPLLNRRGEGTMLLIRSHDVTTGRQFYRTLRATRDSLGLQFRFEIIFDDGSHLLSLSNHFARRVPQKSPDCHVTCYKELEGIPCIVVLAGPARAGLTFPSSLCGVDLRLCYHVTPFSRTAYEYDLSLLNGHYRPSRRRNSSELAGERLNADEPPPKASPTEEVDSVFDSTSHSSPQNVSRNGPALQRSSSSSSSRKSSVHDETKPNKPESTVIIWRPADAVMASARSSVSSSVDSTGGPRDELPSPPGKSQDCAFSSDGTLTVTIDPPCDDSQFYSGTDLCKIPFTVPSVEETMEWHRDGMEVESDSEEEDSNESIRASKVCLLSRPYYHVWSSQSKQSHLLLPPAPGVTWHANHKRPPLFDADPHNQALYYSKWSKPASAQDKSHLDSVTKETAQGAGKRFLFTGPPQVGKTGVWHLLVRLLHDHLHSLKGVVIETVSPTRSIFLQNITSDEPASKHSKHSKIVTIDCLTRHLCNGVGTNEAVSSPSVASMSSPFLSSAVSTTTISTSSYMAYDVSHSCAKCAHLKQPAGRPSELVSRLPIKGGAPITIRWHVPLSLARYCSVTTDNGIKRLEMLKFLFFNQHRDQKNMVRTPVFVTSLGRPLTGLLNLFHSGYQQLQVVVTVESQFERYCQAWPNLIVMALPDHEAMGLGRVYHIIKSFAEYNYQLNVQQDSSAHTTWPMVALMSDNVVMWKKISDCKSDNITMTEALTDLEGSTDCLQYAALSVLQWSEDPLETSHLTNFDLSHDFIVLNLAQTADIRYNQFSFNSADTGFNLALHAAGSKTKLYKNLAIVKKHIPMGGNMYPLHSSITSLCSDVDRVVISLHHDSSSHLPYPGPYLMEHYLLHKSHSLFPQALHLSHPVLVIDNYVTLGPRMHVTVVNSGSLEGSGLCSQSGDVRTRFGGLLLYLCEGKLKSEQINKLCFVPGACLCLVTRNCKRLVQEVARLDLEENWKFRLRDEYQTACSDKLNPLFFLIGRYEG